MNKQINYKLQKTNNKQQIKLLQQLISIRFSRMPPKSSTFYFLHQIKLQTLPYVQKQITQFIDYFQTHLSLQHQVATQQQQHEWRERTKRIYLMMEKKLKQIEHFHYHNWMDYRANLVLRSKKILLNFYQTHKSTLSFLNVETTINNLNNDSPSQNRQKNNENNDLIQEMQQSLQKDQKYSQVKQSVKRIKTQMVQKPPISKFNTKKLQPKQSQKPKNTTINISKQNINKEISKIIDKSMNQQKAKNNLVFASRRTNQLKIDNKNQQKSINPLNTNNSLNTNNLLNTKNLSSIKHNTQSRKRVKMQQKVKESIQKQLNKSKQKSTNHNINNSKQKSMTKNTISKRTQNHQSKKTNHQEDQKQNKKTPVVTKNMSKEQYIQYLINKNKMNISAHKL